MRVYETLKPRALAAGYFTKPLYVVMDPLKSNSMKSSNPHSGFHFEEISLCLDTSTQNPIRNGGGGMVIQRRKKKQIM